MEVLVIAATFQRPHNADVLKKCLPALHASFFFSFTHDLTTVKNYSGFFLDVCVTMRVSDAMYSN